MAVEGVDGHPELAPSRVRISEVQRCDRSTQHLPSRTISLHRPEQYMRLEHRNAANNQQMHRHGERSTGTDSKKGADA